MNFLLHITCMTDSSLLKIIQNKIPKKPHSENLYYLKLFCHQENLHHLYPIILNQFIDEYIQFHKNIHQLIDDHYYITSFQGHVDIITHNNVIDLLILYVNYEYSYNGGDQSIICQKIREKGWLSIFESGIPLRSFIVKNHISY